MTTLDVLRRVRARVAHPANWTRHYFARTASGREVHYSSPDATCWCLSGALGKEADACEWDRGYDALVAAQRDHARAILGAPTRGIADFNDHATHAQVLALIDRAITEAAR